MFLFWSRCLSVYIAGLDIEYVDCISLNPRNDFMFYDILAVVYGFSAIVTAIVSVPVRDQKGLGGTSVKSWFPLHGDTDTGRLYSPELCGWMWRSCVINYSYSL